jgi:hypothetical protein
MVDQNVLSLSQFLYAESKAEKGETKVNNWGR